jgi:cytoskeletal protein CcmA (bactofilin family)
MWKREETPRSPSSPANVASEPFMVVTGGTGETRGGEQRPMKQESVSIGKSIVIKGEVSGSEDLTIEGHVEGTIQLRDHVLTIGPNGKIKAQVFAKAVIVLGEVTGNVTASDKVDIRDNGSVDGDIISPRVAIAEGAHFRGSVDMQRKGAPAATAAKASASSTAPQHQPAPQAAASQQQPQRVGA